MPIRIRPIRALLAGALTTLALAGLAAQAGATSPGARGTLVWGSSTGIYAGDPGDQEDTQHRLSSTDFIGSNADAPSWSPDGTKIAYSAPSYQGGPYAIWVMNADGSGAHMVTSPTVQDTDRFPTWAPEGQRIAYQRAHYPCADENCQLQRQLRVHNVETGDDLLAQTLPGTGGTGFEWSPDGSQIAYEAQGDYQHYDLYVLNDLNAAPKRIYTSGPTSSLVEPASKRLSWSPDGTTLAYAPFGQKKILFFNASNYDQTGSLTPSAPGKSIGALAYTNDGAHMLFVACPQSDPAYLPCSTWQARLDNPELDFNPKEPDEQQVAGPAPQGAETGFSLQPQRQPIIFIHGFAGSRIACGGDELWPPTIGGVGADLLDMRLSPDGSSPAPGTCGAMPSGILDTAYGTDVYKSTLQFLDRLDTNYHVPHYDFVWDWRKDPRKQLIGLNTMINDALNTPDEKAQGVKKVVLMGHSMGGLVMRAYLDDPSRAKKVSRAVTIGTPYWGSPKAIFPLAAGVETPGLSALNAIMALSKSEFQEFARNMAGLYFLYPSKNYGPWLTVDGRSPSPLGGAGLLDYVDSLHGNSGLLAAALDAHANQLDGFKANDVDYRVFVGTGLDTIGAVTLYPGSGGLVTKADVKWVNGDGTVPVTSAVQGPAGTSNPLGDNVPISYVCGIGHVALPGSNEVDKPLVDFLAYGTPPKKTRHLCPNKGSEVNFALAGGLDIATSAAMHSAATSSSSFAGAVAAGKIQLLDLPSGPIVEIDNRIPASFVIHAKNLRMAITPIAGSSRGKTMYYGPITGQLKLVTSTTGKVTVLDNGKPVKARPAAARAISLGYSTKKGSFTGKLRSKASGCVARQQVQVLARKGHSWARAGAARTSKKGAFTIKYGRRAGQYYATIPAGQPGCAAARSKTVTLGR